MAHRHRFPAPRRRRSEGRGRARRQCPCPGAGTAGATGAPERGYRRDRCSRLRDAAEPTGSCILNPSARARPGRSKAAWGATDLAYPPLEPHPQEQNMKKNFRITVDGRSYNVVVEDLDAVLRTPPIQPLTPRSPAPYPRPWSAPGPPAAPAPAPAGSGAIMAPLGGVVVSSMWRSAATSRLATRSRPSRR